MSDVERDAPPWTMDDVVALADGALLSARDGQARRIQLPGPLRRAAPLPTERRWVDDVGKLHPTSQVAAARLWWDALRVPGQRSSVAVLADSDGVWHDAELTYVNLLDHPEVEGVLVALRIRQPAEVIPEVKVVADPGFEAPMWALCDLDSVGTILRADGMVEELYGWPPDEAVGRSILESMHPDDTHAALTMWLELMEQPDTTRTLRTRAVHPDGAEVWVESTVMRRADVDGQPVIVVVAHDVSDRRARETALREQADRDTLTGLMNRRATEDRLAELLASDGPGAVIAFIDLDGFKAINDEADHDTGDRALAELGRRFEDLAEVDDVVGRWGGDEFVILATDLATAATRLPALLAQALVDPIPLREGVWQPAASLGLATAQAGDDPGNAVRRADQAMYLDKQSRRAAR